MLTRLTVAFVGALLVTGSLLLGMNAVTSVFRDRDTVRGYRITNILPKPEPGRPERPIPSARAPDLPDIESTFTSDSGPILQPAGPDPEISLPAPIFEPSPELPQSTTPDD